MITAEEIDQRAIGRIVEDAVSGWSICAPTWAAAVFDRSGVIAFASAASHGFECPARGDIFRIASMSKSFLVACMLLLVERGDLDLDAPVDRYIPSFQTPSTDVVTVKMLISNASGLPEDNGWSDHNLDLPRAEFIALLRKGFHFTEPPGQAYQYSNVAFTVASMILEIVSGERYETFLNHEILEPLGLDSTRYRAGDYPQSAPLARGFSTFDRGISWVAREFAESGATAPVGALFSTVDDIAQWSAWLSAPFQADAHGGGDVARPRLSLLSGASRARMQRIHTPIPSIAGRWTSPRDDAAGYGLGLFVEHDSRFGPIAQHSGGLPGLSANMRWQLDSGIGVVAYATSEGQPVSDRAADLLDAVLRTRDVPARHIRLWPQTFEAARRIDSMLRGGADHRKVSDLLAGSVFADMPAEIRRNQFEAAVARAGGLSHDVAPLADRALWCVSAAQLVWRLPCARSDLQVRIELAEVARQPVQRLVIEPLGAELAGLPADRDLVVRHHRPVLP